MGCESCGAIKDATSRIQRDKRAHALKKLIIVCMAAFLSVLCVCATVLGCTAISAQQETIREQQYALNMQYSGLLDLFYGSEITTEYAETGEGDNGTAIFGDGNYWYGGDYNGESSQNNN